MNYSKVNKTLELKIGADNFIHFEQNSMDFVIEGKSQKIIFKGKGVKVSL